MKTTLFFLILFFCFFSCVATNEREPFYSYQNNANYKYLDNDFNIVNIDSITFNQILSEDKVQTPLTKKDSIIALIHHKYGNDFTEINREIYDVFVGANILKKCFLEEDEKFVERLLYDFRLKLPSDLLYYYKDSSRSHYRKQLVIDSVRLRIQKHYKDDQVFSMSDYEILNYAFSLSNQQHKH